MFLFERARPLLMPLPGDSLCERFSAAVAWFITQGWQVLTFCPGLTGSHHAYSK